MPAAELEALLAAAGAEVEVRRGSPVKRQRPGAPHPEPLRRRQRPPIEVCRVGDEHPLVLADPEDALLGGILAGRFRHAALPSALYGAPQRAFD